MPLGGPPLERTASVKRPARYYLAALRHALNSEGIDVSRCDVGEEGSGGAPTRILWTHHSPPLSDILPPIMKRSLNLPSETLLRALGMEIGGEGSAARGIAVVEETLAAAGIPKTGYAYADGSGLSRMNLASPRILVQVLGHMHRHPQFRPWYDALAVAGVDGTLETRMRGTAAENNVRAKTGTLSRVSALSGYVRSADGELFAFSMIAGNFLAPVKTAEEIQDRALVRLARFRRGPDRPPPRPPGKGGNNDAMAPAPGPSGLRGPQEESGGGRSAFFAFADREYIFTVEMVKPGIPLLNFVSMTDGNARLLARNVRLEIGNRRAACRLLAVEAGDFQQPMMVPALTIHPRSSFGVRLEGDFGQEVELDGASIRIGNEDFRLAPLSRQEFEMLVLRVNRLNLGSPDFREDWRVLGLEPLGRRLARRK